MGCPKIPFAVPLPHEGPAVARERPPVLNHKVDNPRYNVWARHGTGTERKNGVAGGLRLASAGLLDICIEIACSLSYTADTFFEHSYLRAHPAARHNAFPKKASMKDTLSFRRAALRARHLAGRSGPDTVIGC